MNALSPNRGATPVGYVTELNSVEAGAVLYLRLWCTGKDARNQIARDFDLALGSDHGPAAYRSLEELCDLCVRHGRRPLMHHHLTCKCLGADECCFANIIGAAADGEREDAMLIASIMVRADMAPSVLGLAQSLGIALKRMSIRAGKSTTVWASNNTLH